VGKRRKPTQLFLGPATIIRHAETHRILRVECELFGAAAQMPLVLAYADLTTARVQRRVLSKVNNVTPVPTSRLVAALKRAFREAYPQGQTVRPAPL
jgi:hypothetical protein